MKTTLISLLLILCSINAQAKFYSCEGIIDGEDYSLTINDEIANNRGGLSKPFFGLNLYNSNPSYFTADTYKVQKSEFSFSKKNVKPEFDKILKAENMDVYVKLKSTVKPNNKKFPIQKLTDDQLKKSGVLEDLKLEPKQCGRAGCDIFVPEIKYDITATLYKDGINTIFTCND